MSATFQRTRSWFSRHSEQTSNPTSPTSPTFSQRMRASWFKRASKTEIPQETPRSLRFGDRARSTWFGSCSTFSDDTSNSLPSDCTASRPASPASATSVSSSPSTMRDKYASKTPLNSNDSLASNASLAPTISDTGSDMASLTRVSTSTASVAEETVPAPLEAIVIVPTNKYSLLVDKDKDALLPPLKSALSKSPTKAIFSQQELSAASTGNAIDTTSNDHGTFKPRRKTVSFANPIKEYSESVKSFSTESVASSGKSVMSSQSLDSVKSIPSLETIAEDSVKSFAEDSHLHIPTTVGFSAARNGRKPATLADIIVPEPFPMDVKVETRSHRSDTETTITQERYDKLHGIFRIIKPEPAHIPRSSSPDLDDSLVNKNPISDTPLKTGIDRRSPRIVDLTTLAPIGNGRSRRNAVSLARPESVATIRPVSALSRQVSTASNLTVYEDARSEVSLSRSVSVYEDARSEVSLSRSTSMVSLYEDAPDKHASVLTFATAAETVYDDAEEFSESSDDDVAGLNKIGNGKVSVEEDEDPFPEAAFLSFVELAKPGFRASKALAERNALRKRAGDRASKEEARLALWK